MDSTSTTTESRPRCGGRLGAGLLLVLALLLPDGARAHDLRPPPVRELIRIQGYRSPAPKGVVVGRELTLTVLGKPLPFAASDWRSFFVSEGDAKPTPKEPPTVTLQGERALLNRINTARPDQQITILAERRPGAADAFVLAVDLCPR